MKKIGIEALQKSRFSAPQLALRFAYFTVLVLSFSFFALYARITGWIFASNKIDIFNDLDQISFYFWLIDPQVSQQLLKLDEVIQDYLAGENVLKTQEKAITEFRKYAKEQGDYLTKLGFGNYEKIFQMLNDARPMREEIFQLLGKDQRFNYLIPLQNSNEKRPNGGFFGSFAFVSFSGAHIVDLQVVDSYLPDLLAPNTRIPLPERSYGFLKAKSAGFIAGNTFGFTDKDGKNLKTLYEKIFHHDFDPKKKEQMFNPEKWNQLFQKNIKGVIFLDSELISYLLPSFREKSRERQFVNANIDLIRGEDKSNKKELYIKDLEGYLKTNALSLAKAGVNSIQEMLHKGFINIYLSNVSDELWGFLQAYDLTTVYDSDFWYFFNINTSFNKSDGFVKKQIEILDETGKVVLATDERKIKTNDLKPGIYQIQIRYALDIPKTYQDWILALEKKYSIEMTDRERHILALQPKNPDPQGVLKWRESKEIIYFPKQVQVLGVSGDFFDQGNFESDFAKGIFYTSRITSNPTTNTTTIKVQIF